MISSGLALGFDMKEGQGSSLHDLSPFRTDGTITGATWTQNSMGVWYLDFDSGTPDYVEVTCPQCNFTGEDFSLVTRLTPESLSTNHYIFIRGLPSTDGWFIYVRSDGEVRVQTMQAAANQHSDTASGALVVGTTSTLGFSRSGASVDIYKDGLDITSISASHIDPATCSRTGKLAAYDTKTGTGFDGPVYALYIFNCALSAEEHGDWHTYLSQYV